MTQATRKVFEDLFGLAQDYNGMIDKTKFLKILYITKSVGEPVEPPEYNGQEFFPTNLPAPTSVVKELYEPVVDATTPSEVVEFYNTTKPEITENDRHDPSPGMFISKEIKEKVVKLLKTEGVKSVNVEIRRYGGPSTDGPLSKKGNLEPHTVTKTIFVDENVLEKLGKVSLFQRWNEKNQEWSPIGIDDKSLKIAGTSSLVGYLYGYAFWGKPRIDRTEPYNYCSSNFITEE